MTKEEYKTKLVEISKRADQETKNLQQTYAFDNNTYKVGDLITDHCKTIRVEKVSWIGAYYTGGYPECVYYGIKINKDGKDNKKGDKETIYQSNIVN